MLRAPVTLLDEPLSGVDAAGRARLLAELPALLSAYAGTTIVVTHQRDEALALAGSIRLLSEGRLGDAVAPADAEPGAPSGRAPRGAGPPD